MGSNLNFKNFVNEQAPLGVGGGRAVNDSPLTRQSSVYSLTFDEFQSTIGGSGKDFGSMNMDELLKSIWSAEDNQNFGGSSVVVVGGGGEGGGGGLQRQGSLILPRTLSQKTVDEVWQDMSKESGGGGQGQVAVPQKQPTLGEITLEEFLVRAGVVREEAQLASDNAGIFGDLWHPVNSSSGLGFGLMPGNLPFNVNGIRSAGQELENHQLQVQQQRQHQQILPKHSKLAYGSDMGLSSPRIKVSDPVMNNSPVQGGGLGMVGLVSNGSPAVSSDTSSVSPVPYVFNGGLRGRRSAALEKVVERRQRRMIKNRESAARSRARKQAYTMELEAEVAKLKEENEVLQKKQEEMMEMQKNQALEMMKQHNGAKKRCLRRTQTCPW